MKINTWWKYILVAVLAIGIAIWGAEQYLKQKIREELQIETVSGDTLQVNHVDLGLIGGWIDINDLVIRWNIGEGEQAEEQLTYVVKGEVGKVQVKGLSFMQYLLRGNIRIRQLLIDSSSLDLLLLQTIEVPARKDESSPTNSDLVIDIGGIKLAPSSIRYFEDLQSPPSLEIGALNLDIKGFRYPKDSTRQTLLEAGRWAIDDLRYGSPDQFSDLFVRRAEGQLIDSLLTFHDLHFKPRYSKEVYSQKLKNKDSRIDLAVAKGQMSGLDWQALLNTGALQARMFQIDSCRIAVYEDSRLPVDETRYKSLYQEKLMDLDMAVRLDSLKLNGRLIYEVRPKKSTADLGFLDFQELEAIMINITNDSARIAVAPLLQVAIKTVLNGESQLDTYFTFDLTDPNYGFTYNGSMHQFDLSKFNTILSETAKMSITEGMMQRLQFEVDADNTVARGELKIDYSDLQIEWLENHNRLAALAQKVVMLESNPRNGKYRVGQVYFERLPGRSFWNYYVKSLLSGLNSTAMPNLFLPEELDSRKEKE